jgi:hypothetical protein
MDLDTDDPKHLAAHLQEIRSLCEEELSATRQVRRADKIERRKRVKSVLARAITCPPDREAVQVVEDLAEPLIGDARDDMHARESFERVMAEAPRTTSPEPGGVS